MGRNRKHFLKHKGTKMSSTKSKQSKMSPSECETLSDFCSYLSVRGMKIETYWKKNDQPFRWNDLTCDDFKWIAANASSLNRTVQDKHVKSLCKQIANKWTDGLPGSHLFFDEFGNTVDGGQRTAAFAKLPPGKTARVCLWYGAHYEDALEQINAARPMKLWERFLRNYEINKIYLPDGRRPGRSLCDTVSQAAHVLYGLENCRDPQQNELNPTELFKYATEFRPQLLEHSLWAEERFYRANFRASVIAAVRCFLYAIDQQQADEFLAGLLSATQKSLSPQAIALQVHFAGNGHNFTCNNSASKRNHTWAFLRAWNALRSGKRLPAMRGGDDSCKPCCALMMRPKIDRIPDLLALIGEAHSGLQKPLLGPDIDLLIAGDKSGLPNMKKLKTAKSSKK